MTALLEPILESPQAFLYLEQLQQTLVEEQKRRQEFYKWITEDDKAEFINGQIVCHSPVRLEHLEGSNLLIPLLTTYVRHHKMGRIYDEKAMISLTRNDYEPDICYFSAQKRATFQPGQLLFPAPDLIVEILSESTKKRDRGVKMEDYAAHGVQEYWLMDAEEPAIERYLLNGDTYQLVETVRDGILRSEAITGFAVPFEALFVEEAYEQAILEILKG